MKKFLSALAVFGLIARTSMRKVFGIFALLVVSQVALFGRAMEREHGLRGADARLENVLENCGMGWVLLDAFVLITVCLSLTFTERGAVTGYTLRRLSVGEKQVFFMQAVYNCCIYVALLCLQIALGYGLCRWFLEVSPSDYVSGQSVFIAFWRVELLHSVLPLNEAALWIRNGMIAVSLGLGTACVSFKQRRRKPALSAVFLTVWTAALFVRDIGDTFTAVLTMLVCAGVAALSLYAVFKKETVTYEDI
ncbi:MAG: hypothetical protein IJY08_01175 [Clostridia bacterium]|nr:hypothetical protein [Clostridia bacterium]